MRLYHQEHDDLQTFLSESAIDAHPGGICDISWQGLYHRVSPLGGPPGKPDRSRAAWL